MTPRPGAPALLELVEGVRPPGSADPAAVRARLDTLTKPPGSLGRLEEAAVRLATIVGDPPPPLRRRTVFVLAGDHGVAVRGVSAYPRDVTAQMCRNIAAGGAAVSALARAAGARVVVADFGVDADLERVEGVVDRKVRRGTRDLSEEAAMTAEETGAAVLAGATLVDDARPRPGVVALGEMGIGNTTPASVLTAALTGASPEEVVGPGTGVEGPSLLRKRRIVSRALARVGEVRDPLTLLAEVGGLELAGLVGVTLGSARRGIPVVLDGFIATAAALVAVRLRPEADGYLFAGHRSAEPGHRRLLEVLGLDPLLELEMRLGEGTGAVLAIPVLDAAGAILREMATFESAGISRSAASGAGGGE